MLTFAFATALVAALFAIVNCSPDPSVIPDADGWYTVTGLGHGGMQRRTTAKKPDPKKTEPEYKPCDTKNDLTQLTPFNTVAKWEESDDKVFYVPAGTGACSKRYTLETNGICLHPGWVGFARNNGCDKWVQIYSETSGVTTEARVIDACGAGNDNFGCNDALVTQQTFEILAGSNSAQAFKDGHLDGNIKIRFISEPCWACNAGLPGKFPNGTIDNCSGQDYLGYARCGRKPASQRTIGPKAAEVCNRNYKCPLN